MKIRDIAIDHFRGIGNVYIERLDQHMNLFVGINGAGKSSILDAISLVFSWYVARMLSVKGVAETFLKMTYPNIHPMGVPLS